MRLLLWVLPLVASAALAADNETFHGWSKDGTWLVYEVHGRDERNELFFCATDEDTRPTWPVELNDADTERQGELTCVRFIDPNKAPWQWKSKLELPPPSAELNGITVSSELATIGDQGFWLDLKDPRGDKRQLCYASGTREGSKLQRTWFHPSGRYAAAQIDGNFRHCTVTLQPLKAVKRPPAKGTGKKK